MENLGSDMKKHKTWMFWKWRYFGDKGRRERDIRKQNLQGRQASKRQNPVVQCWHLQCFYTCKSK